ncbi:MmcQ/YjbR family DNA-binding protein [Mucilaginibacter sp. HMF5004]|uniref:MmcQ/YjbR family DNA-binding protein n=1 Tax=Mucilaginibacter rivuli TaxID=2857527 RepID=UPI001C5F1B94|nr:MmcQ/YjbR family DNA-binding protein [Mucilaginibacter rivuli]MBW4891949.1 MmcQ/YjbR family DNA-binding protein [Mucilaginibacter rivuli]
MVDIATFRQIALAFPGVTEQSHFHRAAFRVKKGIFATLDADKCEVNIKLTEIDQDVFSKFDNEVIYPVANNWGKQGWTTINLNKIHPDMLTDALSTAYHHIITKK